MAATTYRGATVALSAAFVPLLRTCPALAVLRSIRIALHAMRSPIVQVLPRAPRALTCDAPRVRKAFTVSRARLISAPPAAWSRTVPESLRVPRPAIVNASRAMPAFTVFLERRMCAKPVLRALAPSSK